MTRLLAKTTVIALGGLAIAAALSLTAFGSAGRNSDAQPGQRQVRELHAGDDCTSNGDACTPGTRCSPTQPGSSRLVCLPIARLGEGCGPATGGCADPAFCDDSLHCVIGNAGLGHVCGHHAECKSPLICPWSKHVCSTPAKIGQSCHTNPDGRSECEPGSGCNGTRCVAQKPDGHSCFADEECRAGICEKTGCGHILPPSFADRRASTGY
jgi:hypothetical protein